MIIIGGLGSILGSVFGAIFITVLPMALRALADVAGSILLVLLPTANVSYNVSYVVQSITAIKLILFGVLIIVFLIVEPEGLNKLWRNIRDYFRVWPFSY
jgi:branched-chain amino acid transport system permease protein